MDPVEINSPINITLSFREAEELARRVISSGPPNRKGVYTTHEGMVYHRSEVMGEMEPKTVIHAECIITISGFVEEDFTILTTERYPGTVLLNEKAFNGGIFHEVRTSEDDLRGVIWEVTDEEGLHSLYGEKGFSGVWWGPYEADSEHLIYLAERMFGGE